MPTLDPTSSANAHRASVVIGRAKTLGIYLVLVGACVGAALHGGLDEPIVYNPGAPPNELVDINLRWNTQKVVEEGGTADHATYLRSGLRFVQLFKFEDGYIALWPPGMPLVAATVVASTGHEYYVLKLVLLTCCAWALGLLILSRAAPVSSSPTFSAAAFASILVLPAMREWTFGFGSVMAEGLSCAIFMAIMAAFLTACRTRTRKWFVISALLLALATNFRIYFNYVAEGIFGLSSAVIIFAIVWFQLRQGIAFRDIGKTLLLRNAPSLDARTGSLRDVRLLHSLLLALAVYLLGVEPLRIYKFAMSGSGSLYAMRTKDKLGVIWMNDEEVAPYQHGANPGCAVRPDLCDVMRQQKPTMGEADWATITYATFLAHPFQWVGFKLRNFDWLWFGRSGPSLWSRPWLVVEGCILLLMGIGGAIGLGWYQRKSRRADVALFGLIVFSFYATNAALFMFLHYEWRYSQPMRLFAFALPFFVVAFLRERRESNRAPNVV